MVAAVPAARADAQTPADTVRGLRAASNAAIARHDVNGVLSFMDPSYQVTAGAGTLAQGRDGEREVWTGLFARAADLRYVRTPESVEVADAGERAAEVGRWVGTWTTAEGATHVGGRYAAYWRRVDGAWKIHSELFVTLECRGPGCS